VLAGTKPGKSGEGRGQIAMLEIIQEADLFKGVSEGILAEIVREGEEVAFAEGAIIFNEGEDSQHIYELIEGSVDLIMLKKEIVHLTVSRTGQIFGWSALVHPYRRTATAKCTAPARVIKLSSDSIERIIESHPHEGLTILRNLSRIIAERLKDAYTYIHYYGEGGDSLR